MSTLRYALPMLFLSLCLLPTPPLQASEPLHVGPLPRWENDGSAESCYDADPVILEQVVANTPRPTFHKRVTQRKWAQAAHCWKAFQTKLRFAAQEELGDEGQTALSTLLAEEELGRILVRWTQFQTRPAFPTRRRPVKDLFANQVELLVPNDADAQTPAPGVRRRRPSGF